MNSRECSRKYQRLYVAMLMLPMLGLLACQTVSDQAPVEIKSAKTALDAAKSVDVEDYMPSAMEAAERKFAASLKMLDESASYQADGNVEQARDKQEGAIKLANEAKEIADGSVTLVKDMRAYDSNSGEYLSMVERTTHVATLEKESATPTDFRIGKPIAFFATGSTTLNARYRPEIQQLAELLKKNENLEVTLEGFADPRGSATLNQRLSAARLRTVAEELKAHGIDENRIKTVAVGATADPSSASGISSGELQLDRKVTATILAH